MSSITIQGTKFEVPDGLLAKFAVGYTLQDEGEASALRQTFLENLRNNFANAVKKEVGEAEELTEEQKAKLQSEFSEYASKYKFGVRSGEGRVRLDPLTKEMLALAAEDFTRAYQAKFGEKPDRELVKERSAELMDKRHDDYAKRARAILRQRDAAATDTLAAVGL